MNTKQVIIMRDDIGMRRGKQIAQGAHASLGAFTESSVIKEGYLHVPMTEYVEHWLEESFTKICVRISSEEELCSIINEAKSFNIPAVLITDNGKTEFNGVKTITCGAIGPFEADTIDALTGHLKLY